MKKFSEVFAFYMNFNTRFCFAFLKSSTFPFLKGAVFLERGEGEGGGGELFRVSRQKNITGTICHLTTNK